MKHIIALCIFFSTLPQLINGMINPLGEIEKQIFLREVNRIGREATLQQMQQADFIITLQLKPGSKDQLTQSIIQKINELEGQNKSFKVAKQGYIENYSYYWHKVGHNGAFIKLESTFYDKRSLSDALEDR